MIMSNQVSTVDRPFGRMQRQPVGRLPRVISCPAAWMISGDGRAWVSSSVMRGLRQNVAVAGSGGGLGPAGGTELEAQVLAWLACHVLAGEALPKKWLPAAQVTAVGGQTARQVDDIGAVTEAGGHVLIQSKRGLGLGSEPGSPLAGAIRQVVRQYAGGVPGDSANGHRTRQVDPGRDRLIVVTGHAPESVRAGLVDAVDRLAQLPASLPLSDVGGNLLVVQARRVIEAHLRREWEALRGSPLADSELRGVLRVLRVRLLCADDDGPDWRHAIGLLEKVVADPGDARKAWGALVKYFLEVPAKRQWAGRDHLRDELRHQEFELRPLPVADVPSGAAAPVARLPGVQVGDRNVQHNHFHLGSSPAEGSFAEHRDQYLDRVRWRYQGVELEVLTPSAEQGEQPPIRLEEVFVPQSARLNPLLVEFPRELLRRLEVGEIRDDEIPEEVDRRLLERARRALHDSPPRPVLDVIAGRGGERVVFLGDPGAGKSALGRYLMLSLAAAVPPRPLAPLAGYVPLLVELRAYVGQQWRSGTFLDLIDHQHRSEYLGFPRPLLEPFLGSGGRVLVIFDGLDEIFDSGARKQVARQIEAFASRYPQARVVVTARPTGYQTRSFLENGGFAHYQLQDLDREQIQAFTTAWYAASLPGDAAAATRLRDRVLSAVASSPAVAELAGNPMLLTILAIIGSRQELPRGRREVYEHAVNVLVEHWDTASKDLQDQNLARGAPDLEREDKLELLEHLARRMQQGDGGLNGNRLTRRELKAELEGYLRERLKLPAERAVPAAAAMIRQLRERNYILAHYGEDLYGFVHRAFLEYLAARDIRSRFDAGAMSEAQLLAVYQDRWRDPAWEEVLVLLAGMLPEKIAAQAIDWLLAADPVWFLRDGTPRHLLLAVRFLGEVHKPGALRAQSLAVVRAIIESLEVHHRGEAASAALPVLARLGPDWAGAPAYQAWYQVNGARYARGRPGSIPAVEAVHQALLGPQGQRHENAAERARRRRWVTNVMNSRIGPGASPIDMIIMNVAASSPDDPGTRPWLIRCAATRDARGRAQALRSLADHWASPGTVRLLRRHAESDPVPKVRAAAIEALATVPDGLADCAAWLRERAVHDEHADVRSAAVTAAASVSLASDLADWLYERAVADKHGDVRQAALHGLAGRAREGPRVFSWLRDRAVEDPAGYVRANAIQVMAGLPGSEVPCGWLQDRAVSDSEEYPRRVCIQLLGENWTQAPGMSGWLRDRALAEPDRRVREQVVQALGRKCHDTGTEAVLRDRAANDEDEFVREAAVRALAEGWWQVPGMAGWLRERATADSSEMVRNAALRIIAACWPDAESERFLSGRAAADPIRSTRALALKLLAIAWPGKRGRAVPGEQGTSGEGTGIPSTELELVAAVWHDDPGVLPWLKEQARNAQDESIRGAARQIVGHWRNRQDVIPELRDLAVHGEDAGTRAHALALLAAERNDKGIAELIQDRSAADPDPDVRQRAIEMLASIGLDAPRTIARLQERAMTGGDHETCLEAINMLVLNWADNPGVRSWIRDRAHDDKRWYVRAAAVRALCQEGDVALACERAAADRHVWVRAEAIHAIGRNTRQDQSIAALLRDLAATDPHPRVRGEALEALAPQARDDVRAFFRQRAKDDPDPVVRLRAALAHAVEDHPRYWKDRNDYLLGYGVDDDRLDEEARALLSDLAVTDADKAVRAAALRVLASKMRHDDMRDRQHDHDIEGLLRHSAASDPHPHVRTAAAEALAGDESPNLDYLHADDPGALIMPAKSDLPGTVAALTGTSS